MNQKLQYLLFLISGGISAIANFSSRILFNQFTNYAISITLAYAAGMVVAYVLMRLFVFQQEGINTRDSFRKFTLVNFYGFIQTLLVSMVILALLEYAGFPTNAPEIAHGSALGLLAITSYFLHKHFSFS